MSIWTLLANALLFAIDVLLSLANNQKRKHFDLVYSYIQVSL